MSTDYDAACLDCKEAIHLGQIMAGNYSFGYGTGDEETAGLTLKWIVEKHLHKGHTVRIVNSQDPLIENFDLGVL